MRLNSSIKKYISLRSKAENKGLMHCLWGNVWHNYFKRHTLPSYQNISLWFVGHAVFTRSPQISPLPSPLLGTLMFGRWCLADVWHWCLADKHSCSTSQGCPAMSPTLNSQSWCRLAAPRWVTTDGNKSKWWEIKEMYLGIVGRQDWDWARPYSMFWWEGYATWHMCCYFRVFQKGACVMTRVAQYLANSLESSQSLGSVCLTGDPTATITSLAQWHTQS